MHLYIYLQTLHRAIISKIPQVEAIIQILVKRSHSKRQQIIDAYKQKYDESFKKEVLDVFYGPFRDIVLMLCYSKQYIAKCMHLALISHDEETRRHMFISQITDNMQGIKEKYSLIYGESIATSIRNNLPYPRQNEEKTLLLEAVNNSRTYDIDWKLVHKDARALTNANGHNAGEILNLLTNRSYSQEQAYQNICEKLDIESSYISSTSTYFDIAHLIWKGLNDIQNKDYLVIHCIVSHCEVDMKQIKQAYEDYFYSTLEEDICENTSGTFRDTLLQLCKGKQPT